jgi:SAM-dependent methyltransferase
MFEASKTKLLWRDTEKELLRGEGIDIGCGPDPVTQTAVRFDLKDGDANEIGKYVHRTFDYVFSAHCLEHMHDPRKTILAWWQLVRKGGCMIIVVPDEDLYEQGYWPSIFNNDHKWSFTISKRQSWNAQSVNVLELAQSLPDSKIRSLELQDIDHDMRTLYHGIHSRGYAFFLRRALAVIDRLKLFSLIRKPLIGFFKIPDDQTCHGALTQIQLIVEKL